MAKLSDYSSDALTALRQRVQTELAPAACLQAAAQALVARLYREFIGSVVLVRAYATVKLKQLPAADRAFAEGLAASAGAAPPADDTLILSLLGTSGADPNWNSRSSSKGHLAIPLISSQFVAGIPMVTRLMKDMGIGLDWLDTRNADVVVKKLGNMAGVFYVEDARSSVDESRRKIVPAQDFVAAHSVRTVFGLGGSYVTGCFLTIIFFTCETIPRTQVERFLPLVSTVKTATAALAMERRIYS